MKVILEGEKPSSIGRVLLAWLVVTIPLGWGLYRSVRNSLPLFTAESAEVHRPAP